MLILFSCSFLLPRKLERHISFARRQSGLLEAAVERRRLFFGRATIGAENLLVEEASVGKADYGSNETRLNSGP